MARDYAGLPSSFRIFLLALTMGSAPPGLSNTETYAAADVKWLMSKPLHTLCPLPPHHVAGKDPTYCLITLSNSPARGSFELQGAKSGRLYAWAPQGEELPLVNLGGSPLKPQVITMNSTANTPAIYCDTGGEPDCKSNVWVPISADFSSNFTNSSLDVILYAGTNNIGEVLFENITLIYSGSSKSSSSDVSHSGSGEATSSLISINSSTPAPGGALSHTPSDHPSIGTLVGAATAVLALSAIILALFFLRRRKRRRTIARELAAESPSVDTVTPFPVSVTATDKSSAALRIMKADAPLGSQPTLEPPELQLPLVVSVGTSTLPLTPPDDVVRPASPRQVAQLTSALHRSGLSVNELMSSLARVSRPEVGAHDVLYRRSTGTQSDVMPPQYEA